MISSTLLISACGPTYPREKLIPAVEQLFQKEPGVKVKARLVGKTLYAAFEVTNRVTANFELPKDVVEKLENAMLSVSRIALSTDAPIEYMVVQARDIAWGAETLLIRRLSDLKELFYWRVSKSDFDERLVLETRKISSAKDDAEKDWHDVTHTEYIGRLLASRLNLGAKANPFLAVLLDIQKVTSEYRPGGKSLTLIVQRNYDTLALSSSSVSMDLLKNSVLDQMAHVEKKYLPRLAEGKNWCNTLRVEDAEGRVLFEAEREDWEGRNSNPKS